MYRNKRQNRFFVVILNILDILLVMVFVPLK
jgi:hypothetical protein